jgi:putative serine protease PepD
MDPLEDPPHGPGDEDDEGPGTPWLPPDDRLWRHPSEVRANPPPVQRPPAVSFGSWLRGANARVWFVGATAGVVAALVCALVLVSAGAVDRPSPVVTVKPASSTPVTSTTVSGPPDATAILDSVEPAVVGLTWNSDSGVETGSGVVVYSNGPACYLLTDSGLFSGASANTPIQVESYWGEVDTGHLVGTDPSAGIALVRVDLCVRTGRYPAVGTANLGSVANIQTGQEVYSIGSPAIAAGTNGSDFATGYLDDATSYLSPVNGASNAMFSMLVADLSVDPSAYGGAIVDSSGNLIGIINQGSGQSARAGLTYVTPIDTAIPDVTAIIKDGQPISHAWLGVLQESDISAPGAQGLKVPGAIEVESVASGSPAAKLGIADNDVITSIDGHTEYVSSVGAFLAYMALAKPGEVVDINWLSRGQPRQAHVTLGTEPVVANPS